MLVQADPTPCRALAIHSVPKAPPNANKSVDRNIITKPVNIGTV